jgi:hypothetical protein
MTTWPPCCVSTRYVPELFAFSMKSKKKVQTVVSVDAVPSPPLRISTDPGADARTGRWHARGRRAADNRNAQEQACDERAERATTPGYRVTTPAARSAARWASSMRAGSVWRDIG